MKNLKLIDALPSVFGALSLIGLALVTFYSPNSSSGAAGTFGSLLLYGAGAIALVTGLVSVVSAKLKHSLGRVHILNVVWITVPALFFACGAYIALTWR